MSVARFSLAFLSALACLLFATNAHAGAKVKLVDGDLSALAGAASIQVQFVYEGMVVGKKSEEAYVAEKIAEKNADEAGKGDDWHQRWLSDREGRFHPKFCELMNSQLEDRGITTAVSTSAPSLLMTVKVTRTEPGFYSYVVNKPAEVDFDITVATPDAPDTVIAHLTVERAPGVSVVSMVDTGERISEAYAKAGKDLAKYIKKKAK